MTIKTLSRLEQFFAFMDVFFKAMWIVWGICFILGVAMWGLDGLYREDRLSFMLGR